MKARLKNKVVVVTGASGGIGSALAELMAQHECQLGLIARNREKVEELAGRIRESGAVAVSSTADVGNREELQAAIEHCRSQLGPIDTFVACAGLGDADRIAPFDAAHFEELMRVNWVGLINGVHAVLPEMIERRQGHLVAISSLRGYKGLPGFAGYSATKAAVNTFMDGLRVDLRDFGVNTTTVCPGYVRTAMTESKSFRMPWIMEPNIAARKILTAIVRKRKVADFPWQLRLLMSITRSLPDWLIAKTAPREKLSK